MSTALLARSAEQDRAFERLYKRHVHEVYRYVLAVLRNQADAEDATQATFLNAYRAFSRGEEPLKPRNWLLKIAHNECRQRFRASSRRPKEVEWDERLPAPAIDETVPTVDEIRTALGHLSFNQRSALVMRELEGRSYDEIGQILELSTSAVETLLFRARRALREQLEGSLTCGEAEATLSKRLDGRISQAEQRALRAHLRECSECAVLERKQRARRAAVKRLGVVQLPPSLAGFFGGASTITGGAIAGSGLVAKAAAVVAAGVVAGGVGHQAVQAVAADRPPQTPLPELESVPRQYASPAGAIAAPGAEVTDVNQTIGAPSAATTARRIVDSIGSGQAGRDASTAPDKRDAGSAGRQGPEPVIPVQSTAAPPPPKPVQEVAETAKKVVAQAPKPPIPPAPPVPPPAIPPVQVPTVPLPVLPPPPPLP